MQIEYVYEDKIKAGRFQESEMENPNVYTKGRKEVKKKARKRKEFEIKREEGGLELPIRQVCNPE